MSDLIRRADALALFAENDNIPTEIVRASIENLPAVQLDALAAISRMGAGDGLIKRATAALEGVTGGPWRVDGEPWNQIVWSGAENRVCFMAHSNGLDDDRDIATARFIAFTRQWVPEAAARIAALTAQNREMALDVLASSGQAQEACAAQLAAEAERDALRAVQPDTREAALREALAAVNAKWQSGADTPDEMRGLALAEAAILDLIDKPAHVNKTPKREHDAANMLTPATKGERDD